MKAAVVFALVSVAVSLGIGCKDRGISGIGPYKLGETTLAGAPGVCRPVEDGTVWCFSAGRIAVGQQPATVDLYFSPHCSGAVPEGQTRDSRAELRDQCGDSPLVEILLSIRACKEDAAAEALARAIGKPPDRRAKAKLLWQTGSAVIVAQLPADGTTCEINFVAPTETARIKHLIQ
ncbi:MAG TPA: hypothetical protein VFG83_10145 [Kofleriaceae bacterium]|nr:hypothetical protein [Kofleriaceae bacterium]